MDELFPVLAGIVLGLAVGQIPSPRLGTLAVAVLSVALGVAASSISGELLMSWVFVVIDTLQVAGASIMTIALVAVWRRRARWVHADLRPLERL